MSNVIINPYKFGAPPFPNTYSLDFDGVDDYVDCGTGIGDSLGDNYTGDLSLSMWFKADLISNGLFTIGDFSSSVGEFTISFYSNELYYRLNQGGWTRKVAFTDTSSWHHLLIIYKSGSEANSKMFLDGSEVGAASGTFPATSYMDFAGLKTIIGAYYTNAYGFDGLIDEVAVWSNDQTANAATIYGGGTPGNLTDLSPLVWYRMGDFGTFFNSNWEIPEYTKIDNWSSHSMEFDGIDDYVSVPSDAAYKPTTGEFSVSLWFYATTGYDSVMSGGGFAHLNTGFEVNLTNQAKFILSDGSASTTAIESSYFTMDAWNHFLGTWDGSNMTVYINGVAGTPVAFAGPISWDAAKALYFGTRYVYLSSPYHGNLCDIAIFDNDQSANAVAIYHLGVPTDLTGYSGLVGYWRMGEDATWDGSDWTIPDDSTNSNDGTSSGMAEEDKINTAPGNINQGLSDGMGETTPSGRDPDVP